MSVAALVHVVTGAFFAQFHNAQLQCAIADFPGIKLVIPDVTLVLVVHPENLILPVLGIEEIKIIEEVDLPVDRAILHFIHFCLMDACLRAGRQNKRDGYNR